METHTTYTQEKGRNDNLSITNLSIKKENIGKQNEYRILLLNRYIDTLEEDKLNKEELKSYYKEIRSVINRIVISRSVRGIY